MAWVDILSPIGVVRQWKLSRARVKEAGGQLLEGYCDGALTILDVKRRIASLSEMEGLSAVALLRVVDDGYTAEAIRRDPSARFCI